MKQVVLTFTDTFYEKIRFEAMLEQKDIRTILKERVLFKKFSPEVEKAFDEWMEKSINHMTNDEGDSNEY